ncbi:MAG: orotidine-5'-phosphate decarboxylase [Spirochaetes bacterium]|nr:orotidine-5'-phosphate decarboxylase [Spirochaetota bacterium]
MFSEKLQKAWRRNNSMLCVGLDPDIEKVPHCIRHEKNPVFEFNRRIIDATHDIVCAYKPQIAYYAAYGLELELKLTIDYVKKNYPDILVILDAKRSDIDSTAAMYAKEAFDRYGADAVTVNPYMGTDSIKPFIDRSDKGTIVLCRTSNRSATDFQETNCDGEKLYRRVAAFARAHWNYNKNLAFVVGATYPDELRDIRALCPDIPFLVPGVGAQGGDIARTVTSGSTEDGFGLIISSSRGIIYAGKDENFDQAARTAAQKTNDEINKSRNI